MKVEAGRRALLDSAASCALTQGPGRCADAVVRAPGDAFTGFALSRVQLRGRP
jgi:hypothetical protein